MVTHYHARTDVERWQIQDRLAVRLREIGITTPVFYEGAGGRLAFKINRGLKLSAEMLDRLENIDAATESSE